jgi:hypothetical protein
MILLEGILNWMVDTMCVFLLCMVTVLMSKCFKFFEQPSELSLSHTGTVLRLLSAPNCQLN